MEQGLISRLGAIDPSDGGRTRRYSLYAHWSLKRDRSLTTANAYLVSYALDLFSNFTLTIFNLETGYKYKNWLAQVDVLNLFNAKDHDIDYLYVSRLPGEPADGVADVHLHPVEPRTVRFSLGYTF